MNSEDNNIIKLLWTGGWDSTFRLLQILVILKRNVRPYYILDEDRKSIRQELLAMSKIRFEISKRFRHVKYLLLPTLYCQKHDIEANHGITQCYRKIIESIPLGNQYEWLGRYCEANNINNIEIPVEKTLYGRAYNLLKTLTVPCLKKSGVETFVVKKGMNEDIFRLFKYYEFPLFKTTREEMICQAKKHNFYDILLHTWFCHTPLRGSFPCGTCAPCIDAIKNGFQFRIGKRGLNRYRFRFFLNPRLRKKKLSFLTKLIKLSR